MADVFAPQPVKTKVAGDVVVNINTGQSVGISAGSAVIGKLGIDQTTPGTTNGVQVTNTSLAVTGTFYQATQPVSLATNTPTLQAGSAIAGKFGIDQTTPGTTNGVQVVASLPTGANIVGKLGIDQTTPGTTNGVSVTNTSIAVTGTFYQATQPVSGTFFQTTQPVSLAVNTPTIATGTNVIGALTANQTVNVAMVNGTATTSGIGASSAGTQRVVLAIDQSTVPVAFTTPFTTTDSGLLTSASLAAGATITLDGVQIASGTAKLYEATVSSSVALKAVLGTWDGTTFTAKRTFFVPANASFSYAPARYDAITFPTGTTAKFRWSITNNDNANAADVYASITQAI